VERGIRVNAVSPGPIETPAGFARTGLSKEVMDEMVKGFISMVPMKRIGQPEEIAGTVAFLASQDASFITGAEIRSTADWGKSKHELAHNWKEAGASLPLFVFPDAYQLAPPDGSGDVDEFTSRNHLWPCHLEHNSFHLARILPGNAR